jgi:dihydroflavonol-4-reductase
MCFALLRMVSEFARNACSNLMWGDLASLIPRAYVWGFSSGRGQLVTTAMVTGANGFIGSHLVRELIRRGYRVRCLVRHTSNITSLRGLPVCLYIGDVREPETLVTPMQDVEYVFHLAAELMVTSWEAFQQTNTQGTINMLEAAAQYAPEMKRFVFVSSQAASGPSQQTIPIDETATAHPVSWYGTSKKQAEDAVNACAARLPVTIVRPSSVYGEREKDISQVFPVIEYRLQPQLGLKTKYLVMVDVRDLVDGMIAAAESRNALNNTYFLNHQDILTTKMVIKTIAAAMDKSSGLLVPIPLFVVSVCAPFAELYYHFTRTRPPMTRDKARELSQRFWVSDASKAKHDFGWEARFPLLEGMRHTVAAFRARELELKTMPLDKGVMLWLKYVLSALVTGSVVETIAHIGQYYTFYPWWTVFFVIIVIFGLLFGTLAMLLRKTSSLIQCTIGTLIAGVIEILNALGVSSSMYWVFAPNWPFGITNIWVRSLILGIPGGIFLLFLNFVMRLVYKRRLRMG